MALPLKCVLKCSKCDTRPQAISYTYTCAYSRTATATAEAVQEWLWLTAIMTIAAATAVLSIKHTLPCFFHRPGPQHRILRLTRSFVRARTNQQYTYVHKYGSCIRTNSKDAAYGCACVATDAGTYTSQEPDGSRSHKHAMVVAKKPCVSILSSSMSIYDFTHTHTRIRIRTHVCTPCCGHNTAETCLRTRKHSKANMLTLILFSFAVLASQPEKPFNGFDRICVCWPASCMCTSIWIWVC